MQHIHKRQRIKKKVINVPVFSPEISLYDNQKTRQPNPSPYANRKPVNQIHLHTLIKNQTTKSISTLKLRPKVKVNSITFVTTFNNVFSSLDQIIKIRWNILRVNPNLKDIFQELSTLNYRRLSNLKDLVGISNILDN